ncbi:MAG TPA: hypothetical protein VM869_26610 [Enhygromyxa sp.]|nr:hypothetical protein [Enhygromyxa sp.]
MSSNQYKYLRGAFIAYDPGGYPDDDSKKRTIPFRFNPEGLTRSLTVEQGGASGGTEGATTGESSSETEQAADAALGSVGESFSLLIRLDFHDRVQAADDLDAELGLLPELAALEDLLHAAPSESEDASDGREPVEQRSARPTLLFVWGRKRVFPVRITAMEINETLHNSELAPTRAEVQVSLSVVGDAEARDNRAVADALAFRQRNRRRWAQLFLDRTAQQNTNILPL